MTSLHSPAAGGRSYLAIPGPSVIPEAVLQAMHRPSPNIYAGELIELMPGLVRDLKTVGQTDHHVAIYIGNGHAAWEAALVNTLREGDHVLVPASGHFSHGWADMAAGLGLTADVLDTGPSSPWNLDQIAEALRADAAHRIKAVLAVHVDTSTSVRNDIPALRALMDDLGHPALLMADCIASLGCDRFEMDAWGVDVMVTGCQKGLMVPAGMAFVYFNDKAQTARAALPRVSRYWDWEPRTEPDLFFKYFDGTAPTHHLYGLRVALDLMMDEGMEQIWARHDRFAHAIWAACERWAEAGPLRMNVAEAQHRSSAVTSLRLPAPDATRLRTWTEEHMGVTLGIGLGMAPPGDPAWHRFFRFGHMGHLNGQMVMALLGSVDAGLKALQIPHGPGAVEAAATRLAAS